MYLDYNYIKCLINNMYFILKTEKITEMVFIDQNRNVIHH